MQKPEISQALQQVSTTTQNSKQWHHPSHTQAIPLNHDYLAWNFPVTTFNETEISHNHTLLFAESSDGSNRVNCVLCSSFAIRVSL